MGYMKVPRINGISSKRMRELHFFCMRYDDWREQYKQCYQSKGMHNDGMPKQPLKQNKPTEWSGLNAADVSSNIDLIHKCARLSGGHLWQYLVISVTQDLRKPEYLELEPQYWNLIPQMRVAFFRKLDELK